MVNDLTDTTLSAIIDSIGSPEGELVVIPRGGYAWQSPQMGIF
jgi:hypothetical protein